MPPSPTSINLKVGLSSSLEKAGSSEMQLLFLITSHLYTIDKILSIMKPSFVCN